MQLLELELELMLMKLELDLMLMKLGLELILMMVTVASRHSPQCRCCNNDTAPQCRCYTTTVFRHNMHASGLVPKNEQVTCS